MNTLTRLIKVESDLRKIIQDEGGLELELSKQRVKTVLRIADQLDEVVKGQRADLAAEAEAAAKSEKEERAKAVDEVTRLAEKYGLEIKVLARKTAAASKQMSTGADRPARTAREADATPAEIRAWAREHNMPVPNRGVIPGRIVEAYALANAS